MGEALAAAFQWFGQGMGSLVNLFQGKKVLDILDTNELVNSIMVLVDAVYNAFMGNVIDGEGVVTAIMSFFG